MTDPTVSGGKHRGDDRPADGSPMEDPREEQVAARSGKPMARKEVAQKRLEALTSLNRTSRAFAETIRSVMEENRRFAEEREQLLKRERAARAEAEAAHERLHQVLESIDDAFFALDRQWCFSYVNDRAVKLAGKPREDLLGESVWETFPELVGGAASAEMARAEEQGSTAQFENYSAKLDRWLHYRVYPSRAGLSVYTTDITEQKKAEEALRKSEERYKALYEDNPFIYFTVETQGTVLSVNRFGAQQLGYTVEELVGRTILDLFHEEDKEDVSRCFSACLQNDPGRPSDWEARKVRKDGSTLWVKENLRVVPGPDGDTVIQLICEDITERKQAEKERQRLLARESAARAEAAERRKISRDLHDRVAHSMGVVHQSLQLYKVLLPRNPSQAEAKLDLAQEMAKTALDSTRNLAMELRTSITEGDLESALSVLFNNYVPPDIEAELSIEGDESFVPSHVREQLFLILREAVRNAISHSGCDRILVHVDIIPEKATGTVQDDGCGFDLEGSADGNGLKSMKERAALVGGTCSVQSAPNEGTRVQISVPLAQAVQ